MVMYYCKNCNEHWEDEQVDWRTCGTNSYHGFCRECGKEVTAQPTDYAPCNEGD